MTNKETWLKQGHYFVLIFDLVFEFSFIVVFFLFLFVFAYQLVLILTPGKRVFKNHSWANECVVLQTQFDGNDAEASFWILLFVSSCQRIKLKHFHYCQNDDHNKVQQLQHLVAWGYSLWLSHLITYCRITLFAHRWCSQYISFWRSLHWQRPHRCGPAVYETGIT